MPKKARKAVETITDQPAEPASYDDISIGPGGSFDIDDPRYTGPSEGPPSPPPHDELEGAARAIAAIPEDDITPLADDAQNAPQLAAKAPQKPESLPKHPLDLAPLFSKVVVALGSGAMLATPESLSPLDQTDPANRLPVGARILKTAEDEYRSLQLGATKKVEERVYRSAHEAISRFMDDFYHDGLHR